MPNRWTSSSSFIKNNWIFFNNSISFLCKLIIKQGSIVQPIAAVLDLNMDMEKDPSASTNPVTNQGFKAFGLFLSPSLFTNEGVM